MTTLAEEMRDKYWTKSLRSIVVGRRVKMMIYELACLGRHRKGTPIEVAKSKVDEEERDGFEIVHPQKIADESPLRHGTVVGRECWLRYVHDYRLCSDHSPTC